jgi:cytidylate kinase
MIVTISRAYGAEGKAVATSCAAQLGYRLLDDELPTIEGRSPRFRERLLVQLGAAIPELSQEVALPENDPLTETSVLEIERLVGEAASTGDVVIVGRCAGLILGARPDVVRIFVLAALDVRIARVRAALDCDAARARSEIARVDEARRTFAQQRYRVVWGDPANYDLVIDTGRFGVEGSSALVVTAVRTRENVS